MHVSALAGMATRTGWDLQIRRMEAAAAAAIAKALVSSQGHGGWPEALQWMEGAARSQTPLHREMALVLLASLMEKIGALLNPNPERPKRVPADPCAQIRLCMPLLLLRVPPTNTCTGRRRLAMELKSSPHDLCASHKAVTGVQHVDIDTSPPTACPWTCRWDLEDSAHRHLTCAQLKQSAACAGTFMVPHLASALDMALASLQDPAPQLRRAATAALIAVAPWAVDATSVKAFQARMPQILQVTATSGLGLPDSCCSVPGTCVPAA